MKALVLLSGLAAFTILFGMTGLAPGSQALYQITSVQFQPTPPPNVDNVVCYPISYMPGCLCEGQDAATGEPAELFYPTACPDWAKIGSGRVTGPGPDG
jgi:hypothetical protein